METTDKLERDLAKYAVYLGLEHEETKKAVDKLRHRYEQEERIQTITQNGVYHTFLS